MAAIFASEAGAETTLLERTEDGGRKILIAGGGRCNILPSRLDESRFITDSSPHTMRNIIRSWPQPEQVAFFERELGQALVEEPETAKLFPASNKARDVRDGLLAVARRRGARTHFGALVKDVVQRDGAWRVIVAGSEPHVVDRVIIAAGGLSVPSTGSEGFGLRLARSLGHEVHEPYPALTPLTAQPAPFAGLSGVSLTATVTAKSAGRRAAATGGFLFTHRGYSGPAVLDVSHIVARTTADAPARVTAQWSLGEEEWQTALRGDGSRTIARAVREQLPERLALALLTRAGVAPETPLARLKREHRLALIDQLVRCDLGVTGHEGYRKAEVTGGGVSLGEINPRTMESRRCPGLYFCGEVLDAFGPIGGYNFLWAWVTGRAAGAAAGS
jgi:predicted Rossmann fold flavoprotein